MRITKKMLVCGLLVMLCIIASYAYRYFSPIYPFWVSEAKQKEIQEFYGKYEKFERRKPHLVTIEKVIALNDTERTLLTNNFYHRPPELQKTLRLKEITNPVVSHMLLVRPKQSITAYAYQIGGRKKEPRALFPIFIFEEKGSPSNCGHSYKTEVNAIILTREYYYGDYVKIDIGDLPSQLQDVMPRREFRFLGYSDYKYGFPKADQFANDAWPTISCSHVLEEATHKNDFYVLRYFQSQYSKRILEQQIENSRIWWQR